MNLVFLERRSSARALAPALAVGWAVLMGAAPVSAEPTPRATTSGDVTSQGATAPSESSTGGSAQPPADAALPAQACPYCGITPQYPEGRRGLHWHSHWNKVGLREYIVTPVAAAVAIGVPTLIEPARKARWDSPILFDSAAEDLLHLGSPGARKTAADISDVLYIVAYAQPMFDVLVAAWWLGDAPDVAWQMAVIDAQAFALTMALSGVVKRLTSRARPWFDPCEEDPTGVHCGEGGAFSSFYSGHASFTATGAGLICAHHTQLPLYGNPYLDGGACVTALLSTAVTGALRIASDNHWASDVIVGHIMGYLSGYLMPTLLYYEDFSLTPHDDAPPARSQATFTLVPMPIVRPGSVQLGVFGLF